jgi:hypothetical protein
MADNQNTPGAVQPPTDEDYASEAERLLDQDPEVQGALQKDLAEQAASDKAVSASTPKPVEDTEGFNPWRWVRKAGATTPGGEAPPVRQEDKAQYIGNNNPDAEEGSNLSMAEKMSGQMTAGNLWDTAKGALSKVDQAVTRGVAKAGDAAGRTALEAVAGLSKATGAYKLGRSPEEQQQFLKWYAQSSEDWQAYLPGTDIPLLANKEHLDKWAGKKKDGAYGFVESASQFTAGMAVAGEALGAAKGLPLVGKAFSALNNTKWTKAAIEGAITDATFFDPYEERLSNMLKDGPDYITGPIQDYILRPFKNLAADKEDGKFMARIKATTEGFITGQVMEGLMMTARVMRNKMLLKEGKIAASEHANEIAQLKEEFAHLFSGETKPEHGPAVAKGNTVEIPPEFDIQEVDAKAPEKVANVDDIKPDHVTVVKGEDGKRMVRAIERPQVGPEKHYDIPLDDPEAVDRIWELKRTHKPSETSMTSAVAKDMPKEEWDKVEPLIMPRTVEEYTPINAGKEGITEETAASGNRKARGGGAGTETPNGVRTEDDLGTRPGVGQRPRAKKQVASAGEAQAQAATFNMATENIQKEGAPFLGKEEMKQFNENLGRYTENGDAKGAAETLNDHGFNPGYIQQPEHVVNQIRALTDAASEASTAARSKGRTWEEVRKEAKKIFPELTDDAALRRAAKLFGDNDNLPENLLAMRAWMWHQSKQVAKLSKLASEFPENALVADQHMAALNTLLQVHAYVTGATTRTAQAMNVLAHPLGELTEDLAKARQGADAAAMTSDTVIRGAGDGAAEAAPEAAAKGEARVPPKPLTVADKLQNAVNEGKLSHRAPGTYDIAKSMTKREIQALSRMITMTDGNLEGMLKLINGPKLADVAGNPNVSPEIKKNFGKFINTYRAEALLSSPATQLGNIINNAGLAIKRPLQYFWAGLESGNKALEDEGKDILNGLFVHWHEAASIATKAFKQGRNIFDAGAASIEREGDLLAMDRSNLNFSLQGLGNGAQMLFKMPSRMLMSADEFFKQLSARAYTRAQVFKQARAEGITSASVLAQRASDSMKVAFDPEGGAVFPDAIKYAKDVTFTEDLGPVAQKMADLIQSNEVTKFIIPFFKTPANIFHHAWEEAPVLNLLNKKMVEDLNAGGARAAIARAKSDFGSMMYGMAALMAVNGKLSGGGPSDPALRKQWQAAGNQPYSLRVGDTQVSYRRGDPFSTSLGLVADIVAASGEMDMNTKLSSAALAMTTIANNVTSKTFMAGLSDFLDAVSSGKVQDSSSFMKNAVGSFIPNVLNRGNTDDHVREARTVMDSVLSRMPGTSANLEPRRNLFGEKVMKAPGWSNRTFNPFTFMGAPGKEDVAQELLKLGKAMPMPNTTVQGGRIDLTDRDLWGPDRNGQSPYDRWLEMMNEPPWGAMPLREAVEQVVQNPAYEQATGENAWGPGGQRYMMVAGVVQAYQEAAYKMMLQEYPSLMKATEVDKATTNVGKFMGRKAAQDTQQQLQELLP